MDTPWVLSARYSLATKEPDEQGDELVGIFMKHGPQLRGSGCGALDTEEACVLELPSAFKTSKVPGREGVCPGPGRVPVDFMLAWIRTGATSRRVSVVKSRALLCSPTCHRFLKHFRSRKRCH